MPRHAAGDCRDGVDDQDAADAGNGAVLLGQAGLFGDAGDGAHRVEEVAQHDREDREHGGDQAELAEGVAEVEVAEGGERRGDGQTSSGTLVTPAIRATIVVTRMLMIRAARILSTYSEKVISRPSRKTNWPVWVGNARADDRRAARPE